MQTIRPAGSVPQLGSVGSGQYSLLLDKHQNSTYWAIRETPTHETFVAFLISSFEPSVPKAVAAALAHQLANRAPAPAILSHGEICPRNIIVDNNRLLHVTGWDCAGWYPEWWDYVKFFEARTSDKNSDWYEYAGEIFAEEFPNELAAYQGIVRCQMP